MSNNILSDSIGVNDIEENGSMSMKEIENTSEDCVYIRKLI